jgi:cytochrome P450/NADPH-cytochrome P450 reductase
MNSPERIPSPPAWPFLGHLPQLPRGRFTQYLTRVANDYPEGIFDINFGGVHVHFVHDAALVAELSDAKRFRKLIAPPLSTLRKGAGDGLFTAAGREPNWGKAHRILMPAFGQRAMRGYFPLMLEVARELVAKWERLGPQADLAVSEDMTRLTLDTISIAGFGYRFESFRQENLHPFLEAMVRVLCEVMDKLGRLPFQDRLMTGRRRRYLADIATLHELVDEVIRARRAHPTEARDLLNLMRHSPDPLTGETLDDQNIRYQVITFLVAGHETTSGMLSFALYLLLRHPEVLAQAVAEVDRVLPEGTEPEYAHLDQLDVIGRVLDEALRLWPTAPSYSVAPLEDTLLGGRYALRAGQRVSVLLTALHRNPRYWSDPERFDIERWTPQAQRGRHPHAWKPFGSGERACIGRQFALTEARLALALILRRFEFSMPADYRFRVRETLTLKPDGFTVRARVRGQAITPERRAEAA